jgi:hypothetical protein
LAHGDPRRLHLAPPQSASEQFLVSAPAGPDWLSGGAAGPEGSILRLPVELLLAWIVVRTLPSSRDAVET